MEKSIVSLVLDILSYNLKKNLATLCNRYSNVLKSLKNKNLQKNNKSTMLFFFSLVRAPSLFFFLLLKHRCFSVSFRPIQFRNKLSSRNIAEFEPETFTDTGTQPRLFSREIRPFPCFYSHQNVLIKTLGTLISSSVLSSSTPSSSLLSPSPPDTCLLVVRKRR